MEYYLAIKRNKVLTLATMCMNLENVTLCEKSPTQKIRYDITLFIEIVQKRQIHRDETES